MTGSEKMQNSIAYADPGRGWKPMSTKAPISRIETASHFEDIIEDEEFYLARMTEFKDPREGFFTDPTNAHMRGMMSNFANNFDGEFTSGDGVVNESTFEDYRRAYRRIVFVHCWRIGRGQTRQAWRAYTREKVPSEGVAMRTSAGAFDEHFLPANDMKVTTGRVRYVPFGDTLIPYEPNNAPCFYKDSSLSWEEEYRIMIRADNHFGQGIYLPMDTAYRNQHEYIDTPDHIKIEVDLKEFFDTDHGALIVAPGANDDYLDYIRDLTSHLNVPVERSSVKV